MLRTRFVTAALTDDALADNAPLFGTISRHLDERMLAAIAAAVRSGRADTSQRLAAWRERLPPLARQLGRREGQSLFDPKTLRAAVEGRLPERAS